jgi:hypothetical protein
MSVDPKLIGVALTLLSTVVGSIGQSLVYGAGDESDEEEEYEDE